MGIKVKALDHLVLTVASIEATITFYSDVLGMEAKTFSGADGSTRTALLFGNQKINLHEAGHEFEPKAATALPGTADLCLLCDGDIAAITDRLHKKGVAVELGTVPRTGATGPITSVYIRDPDGNLLELSVPANG